MYPKNPEMNFECGCSILVRKNIWSDITGVHVVYCPICGDRSEEVYEPTLRWEETGRGLAGEPIPAHVKAEKDAADIKRATPGPKVVKHLKPR